jgi:molybdenum cofactor biosynthesis enzyme MoaA
MATRKTTTSNEVKDRWKAANYTRINIYLTKEDAEKFKEKCKADGLNLSDIPKKAILDYIAE